MVTPYPSPAANEAQWSASRELLSRASRVVPGGVHSGRRRTDPPICVRSAHGAYLETVDGYRYIDYRAGAGAVILGHADPVVDAAVCEAITDGVLFGVGTTEREVAAAEKLVDQFPSADQFLICGSGSEATYYALRLARAVTGREIVVKAEGCYHGFHDCVLINCEVPPDMLGRRYPHSAGTLAGSVESVRICRYNDLEQIGALFARSPESIAAIIIEPIAHNGPGINPDPDFLPGLRALCNQYGALLIFDEVITCRHGKGGYQALSGVMPDLTTVGKSLANGYPFAALGGRRQYMARFTTHRGGDTVWAGTYNANVVGVTAALATMQRLDDGSVYEHLTRLGDRMRAGLAGIVSRLGVEAAVCGFGSLFCLWFAPGPIRTYDDVARNDVGLFERYRSGMIGRGVLEYPNSDGARSHLMAAHTEEDVARTLRAAEDSLREALTVRL